jgi:hypothetical protein
MFIAIFGIIYMILAFKNEDAEGNARAISMMVIGAVLVGFSMIVPSLLFGTDS